MTVFSDNAERWMAVAKVTAALMRRGEGLAIIKLQIDITLQRYNGFLWLRTSFTTGFGPHLATAVNVCDFSIPGRACRCCLLSSRANFKKSR